MFASTILFSALASLAVAAPVARDTTTKAAPAGWAYGYLEPYNTYHTRYLALDCQDQHGTEFFDQCCHPLLATETLEANRPAQCVPDAAAQSSASAAEATNASANGDAVSQYQAQATDVAESQAAAPASTTDAAQPTQAAPVTEAAAASPSPSPAASDNSGSDNSGSDNSGGDWNTGGQATFFYQNGNPGACGNVNSDSTPLVAIDVAWWPDMGSSQSQYCGKFVEIVNTDNGNSVTAMVQDVCPSCSNGNSLDLSTGAFDALGSESSGVLPIKWKFV